MSNRVVGKKTTGRRKAELKKQSLTLKLHPVEINTIRPAVAGTYRNLNILQAEIAVNEMLKGINFFYDY